MNGDLSRWDIWHTHYLPYAEVLTFGDKPRERVLRNLPYKEALEKVKELGFGYSMHPAVP